jgi:PAS domain S-box-containing protein
MQGYRLRASEPERPNLESENAALRERIAALESRVIGLEARNRALMSDAAQMGRSAPDGEKRREEPPRGYAARIAIEAIQRTQALRKSEAMLAEAQRLARIGSWELDVATRQLSWSEQQFRNFGFAPSKAPISRARVITHVHPHDLERHEAVVQAAIEAGEGFAMDYRVVHPDGTVLNIHSIGRPIFDDEGRLIKFVGTSQDVTVRSRLEEQLRKQYDQLLKLDQLKNNFVNSVTHELRTPLTTIMGYAEFMEDEIGGPVTAEQRVFISQIQRGARRLEYLLNDLLDFARMEAGTFTLKVAPANLRDRVIEVISSLRPQADEMQLVLAAQLPEGPLELEMDAQRIGQVMTNLITNALKFSPKGATITVSAARHGEMIRCEVQDAGPGISAEDMPRLFQRFSQLEAGVRMGKGAGLGLSISKALVEAHGGSIGVSSTPGLGSTFWFELPVTHTQASTS